MVAKRTRSFYLPEDVEQAIALRTPEGWSKSLTLTRIVRRYVDVMEVSTPELSNGEWQVLLRAGVGSPEGFTVNPFERLEPALKARMNGFTLAEQVAIWDHAELLLGQNGGRARSRAAKRGGRDAR